MGALGMAVIFITGPVRSGKSAFAVELARRSNREVTYVATAAAEPEDAEWRVRLSRHRLDRPASWRTVETAAMPHDAQLALLRDASPQSCLLVDALGRGSRRGSVRGSSCSRSTTPCSRAQIDREAAEFADAMLASRAHVIAVSEQIGWDVVPVAASARLFRDGMGRMAQRLAERCERVYLVVAGYAIDLRAVGSPVPGEDRIEP